MSVDKTEDTIQAATDKLLRLFVQQLNERFERLAKYFESMGDNKVYTAREVARIIRAFKG